MMCAGAWCSCAREIIVCSYPTVVLIAYPTSRGHGPPGRDDSHAPRDLRLQTVSVFFLA